MQADVSFINEPDSHAIAFISFEASSSTKCKSRLGFQNARKRACEYLLAIYNSLISPHVTIL